MADRDRHAIVPGRARPAVRGILAGVPATALLCLALPHTLLAAPSFGSGCDSVARQLKSVEIPVETLTVEIVDHMTDSHDDAMDPVIGHEGEPTAPLLFLTPRVAHILQDVFGNTEAVDAAATPMERVRRIMLAAAAAAGEQGSPPAAVEAVPAGGDGDMDAATELDGSDPISSGPLVETYYDVDTLPRFQRRMYRNDI